MPGSGNRVSVSKTANAGAVATTKAVSAAAGAATAAPTSVESVKQKVGGKSEADKVSARIREIDAERKDLYQGKGRLTMTDGKSIRREGSYFRTYQRKRYSELMREREKLLSGRNRG